MRVSLEGSLRVLQDSFKGCYKQIGSPIPGPPNPTHHCLVLSREWGNGLWRLLLGII